MDIETAALRAKMTGAGGTGSAREIVSGNLKFYEGELEGISAVVVKSGVGKVNAALCAQRLVLEFGVTHIINTGIAGAMAHGLGIFDIVVSTDAVYHDMDATGFGYKPTQIPQMEIYQFPADKAMITAAEKAFNATAAGKIHKLVKGRIASGDQFISSNAVKLHIREICSPACVEMEGAAIAHACWLNKVPFVIIRCMSDMAEDGEGTTYSFNEKDCAEESAALVFEMMKSL